MHPLSTAVFATAPRAYYTYPPPFLQEEQGLRLCVRIILCGVEFSKLGTAFYVSSGRPSGGKSFPRFTSSPAGRGCRPLEILRKTKNKKGEIK